MIAEFKLWPKIFIYFFLIRIGALANVGNIIRLRIGCLWVFIVDNRFQEVSDND